MNFDLIENLHFAQPYSAVTLIQNVSFLQTVRAGGGVIFSADGERWSIIEEPIMSSTNSSSPPTNRSWELQDIHSGNWNGELSLLVIPFSPEGSIYLEYMGENLEVKEVFEEQNITGVYVMQNVLKSNASYYVKLVDPVRYLFRHVYGGWVVAAALEDSDVFLYYDGEVGEMSMEGGLWCLSKYASWSNNNGAVVLSIIMLLIILGILLSA